MKYKVNWDNGANACGTFSQVFDTQAQAQAFADNWVAEMRSEVDAAGPDMDVVISELATNLKVDPEVLIDEDFDEDYGYSAEVIEVDDDGDNDEPGPQVTQNWIKDIS